MTETTYRRNRDGMMQEIVPEARGKAAAMSAYLAQGGGLTDRSGLMPGDKRTRGGQITRKGKVVHGSTASPGERYTSGPMAGMTVDQATQKAEGMWAKAPDAIKEKYASRSDSDLAPSERRKYAEAKAKEDTRFRPVTAVPPVPMTATTPAPLPVNSFTDLTKAPVAPAGGVQSVGDGSSAENGWTPQPRQTAFQAKMTGTSGIDPQSPSEMNEADTRRALSQYMSSPLAAQLPVKDTSTPLSRAGSSIMQAGGDAMDSIGRVVAKPFMSDEDFARRSKSTDDGRVARAAGLASAQQARESAVRSITGTPTPAPAAPQTALTPVPPTSSIPPMLKRPDGVDMLGKPPMAPATTQAPRISRLTGLPFGYRPGDSTVGLDQAKVTESNQRMQDAAAANAPRAIPVVAPTPSLRDRHSAAVADYKKDLDPAKVAAMNQTYSSGTDLEKAQIVGDTLKRSSPLAQRDSALAASTRKPLTVATRLQFSRR